MSDTHRLTVTLTCTNCGAKFTDTRRQDQNWHLCPSCTESAEREYQLAEYMEATN